MRIGNLELRTNLFLAPLAGYTNLPFRLVLRELGGLGLATTDLVNARSLLERRDKAFQLIQTRPADSPLAVQLFGSVPEEMRDAAVLVQEKGAAIIDINMGCPARKVCRVGGGSAMMTNLERTIPLVRGIVQAVSAPVTVKMRLGWDDQNITAPELACALEDAGVAAVTIHGRTREQGFSGMVNLAGIREVVRAVKTIPVIGNGDITTPEAANVMMQATGCAGVSIGRGAFYHPWIFHDTDHFLKTGVVPPEPPFSERLRVMHRHMDLMVEIFGEEHACRMFRKVAPWYARRFGPASEFNRQVVHISTRADFDEVVAHYIQWRKQFEDDLGELQPRFRPAPLLASFMDPVEDDAHGLRAGRIHVPKGPVDMW